jgi:enoyl-CoA hydratase
MGSEIELRKDNGVGIVTVNRPEVRNALNSTAWLALEKAFLEAKVDPEIRVIIVTGAGDKAFVAGADLNALRERSAVDTFVGKNREILREIESIGKPTIAAINGYALGAGLELAMACDLRICSRNAKLGQTEINVGILPGAGGTQRLTRLVGLGKAKEMIFTGKIITAEEAEKIGLVNTIVEPEGLMENALEMARQMAAKSPWVLQIAKYVINAGVDVDLNTALALERLGQTAVFSSSDHMEGIMAFLEKRKPQFKGC